MVRVLRLKRLLPETAAGTDSSRVGGHCRSPGAIVVLLVLGSAPATEWTRLIGCIVAIVLLIVLVENVLEHLQGFLRLGILHMEYGDALLIRCIGIQVFNHSFNLGH